MDKRLSVREGLQLRINSHLIGAGHHAFVRGPLLMAIEAIASIEPTDSILEDVKARLVGETATPAKSPPPQSLALKPRVSLTRRSAPLSSTSDLQLPGIDPVFLPGLAVESISVHGLSRPSQGDPLPSVHNHRLMVDVGSPIRARNTDAAIEAMGSPLQDLLHFVDDARLDDVTCPVCLEVLYRPLSLACGHVYCTDCALKATGLRVVHGTLANILSNVPFQARCPQCHQAGVYDRFRCRTMPELEALARKLRPEEWELRNSEYLAREGRNEAGIWKILRPELNEDPTGQCHGMVDLLCVRLGGAHSAGVDGSLNPLCT